MDKRKIAVVVFGVIILVMSVITYINKDEWFNTKVTLTYSDGCQEVYENSILTTPICENGRALEKMREEQQFQQPNMPTMPSLT